MDLLPLGEPTMVNGVYTQKFEAIDLMDGFRTWQEVVKGKYYYADGTVLTEDVMMKQIWDAHRAKCDFHKDIKKRPKD